MIMSTEIRAELSKKSPYWIPKSRYHELRHFCLQYEGWKRMVEELDGLAKRPDELAAVAKTNHIPNPTEEIAIERERWQKRIDLVEKAAKKTDEDYYGYLIEGITQGVKYDILNMRHIMPMSRDSWYILYRKFFYVLNDLRD